MFFLSPKPRGREIKRFGYLDYLLANGGGLLPTAFPNLPSSRGILLLAVGKCLGPCELESRWVT
jgi:hypothetical protein